jgi:hypothetical protein
VVASAADAIEGRRTVESTRKLRRELGYQIAKLHGLQQSIDLTPDEPSAKSLAGQIREQAGICLGLLDEYQASVPGRLWSDAERKCQPLREELRHTEKLFRVNAGEWEGRTLTITSLYRASDWQRDGGAGSGTCDHWAAADAAPHRARPGDDADADDHQSLEALMALFDDAVERDEGTATGPLRFMLPTDGESPGQNMLVLVPRETGLVFEHQYGGFACRHAEMEGFLVPAWAHPEAREALDQLFLADLGGNGVRDEDRSVSVRRVSAALRRIWYRGTGDRMAPLEFDDERTDEMDEAWVPVLTPDGPAFLAWTNSDEVRPPTEAGSAHRP